VSATCWRRSPGPRAWRRDRRWHRGLNPSRGARAIAWL
jgi:hypothetical protein